MWCKRASRPSAQRGERNYEQAINITCVHYNELNNSTSYLVIIRIQSWHSIVPHTTGLTFDSRVHKSQLAKRILLVVTLPTQLFPLRKKTPTYISRVIVAEY